MKRQLKYFVSFTALIYLLILNACKKETANTTVSGIVKDTVLNKVAANQKVIVVSCYAGNFRPICGNLIASTITNSRGEFKISFAAPKNPFGYEIRAGFDSTYYYSSSQSEEVIPLQNNNYTLHARGISYLKLNIKVLNNPLNPLLISCGNSFFTLTGSSIDTIIYCKILPKSATQIVYNVFDLTVNKNRQVIDTLNIGLQDTTAYSKQILDTRNMPIR